MDSVGFGIILPVLPDLIMQISGENLRAAAQYGGWLMFTYAFMQFFFAPVLGNLSDAYGRRPVLLLSMLVLSCVFDVINVLYPHADHGASGGAPGVRRIMDYTDEIQYSLRLLQIS